MSEHIKLQHDPRADGRHTLTIKLIGWELSAVRGLLSNLALVPFGRDIARVVRTELAPTLDRQIVRQITLHRDSAGAVTCRQATDGWVIGADCEQDHPADLVADNED